MNFTQYLAGDGTGGPYPDCPEGYVCFEDGTSMPLEAYMDLRRDSIGTRHDPAGIQGPSNPHLTWADATGGGFRGGQRQEVPPVYGDQTGGPQPYGPPSTPGSGPAFAALVEALRKRKRGRPPQDRRTRGDE